MAQQQKGALWISLVGVGLSVVALAVALFVLFAGGKEATAPTVNDTQLNRAVPTTSNSAEPEEEPAQSSAIPADWKTYTDTASGFTFRYPFEWGAPQKNEFSDGENPLSGIVEHSAGFEPMFEEGFRFVNASTVDEIRTSEAFEIQERVDELLAIYEDRSIKADQSAVILPPVNAGLVASTTPKYVESGDGTFRGMSYIAFVTQGVVPEGNIPLTELHAVVTNGDIVVHFYSYVGLKDVTDGTPNGTYGRPGPCLIETTFTGAGSGASTCTVPEELTTEYDEVLTKILGSLKLTS